MLNTEYCKEYLEEVIEAAKKMGKWEGRNGLKENLDYLANYACHTDPEHTQCNLFKDFVPLSFEFVMMVKNREGEYVRWFNGGCIFHGNHDGGGDGGAPTFSVCLNPTDGWSIHT